MNTQQGGKPLKTDIIVHYLLSRISRSGTEPEPLPTEMELCNRFQVSRVTVRRAIQILEDDGDIIRLPGRRGAFTNPAAARSVPHAAGVIVASGSTFSLDHDNSMALSGFLKKMSGNDSVPWYYFYLSVRPGEDIEPLIAAHHLEALLWLSPAAEALPELKKLADRHFPAVSIGYPSDSNYPVPAKNTILRDFSLFGKELAGEMLRQGFRCPVYCGNRNITFESFQRIAAENGLDIQAENVIEKSAMIEEKLPEILKQKNVDVIYSSGSGSRYLAVLRLLSSHPEYAGITLLMERSPATVQHQRDFPGVKIVLLSKATTSAYMYRAGERAASILWRLYREPWSEFSPIVL